MLKRRILATSSSLNDDGEFPFSRNRLFVGYFGKTGSVSLFECLGHFTANRIPPRSQRFVYHGKERIDTMRRFEKD